MMHCSGIVLPVVAFVSCALAGCCGFPGASDLLASKPIGGAVTHFQGEDPRLPGFAEKHFADRPFKVMFIGTAVRDATYLLGVPHYCPDTPVPEMLPFVMYGGDSFKEPALFRADLAVADDDVMDVLLEAWACHESQKFEWLPPQKGLLYDQVPKDHAGRIALLRDRMMPGRLISNARRHRKELDKAWGGCGPKYAEVFELCDYARKPVAKEVAYLRSLGFKWIGPEPKTE